MSIYCVLGAGATQNRGQPLPAWEPEHLPDDPGRRHRSNWLAVTLRAAWRLFPLRREMIPLVATFFLQELCVSPGPAGRQDQLYVDPVFRFLGLDPCLSPADSRWAMLEVERDWAS